MADYRTFIGSVAWDAETREAAGKRVKNFPLLVAGNAGVRVQVALWEEKADFPVSKNDFVIVHGTYVEDEYKDAPVYKLNANKIQVLGGSSEQADNPKPAAAPKKTSKVTFG